MYQYFEKVQEEGENAIEYAKIRSDIFKKKTGEKLANKFTFKHAKAKLNHVDKRLKE